MAIASEIRRTGNVGSFSFQNDVKDMAAEAVINVSGALQRSWSGELTTRTDANTGTFTLEAGHGIQSGDVVTAYWTVAGVNGHQRRITIGTVSVNSAPFDLGVGDNLPIATTPIILCKETVFDVNTGGHDALAMFMRIGTAAAAGRGRVQFYESDGTTEAGGVDMNNGSVEGYNDSGVFQHPDNAIDFTAATIVRVSQTYAGVVDFDFGATYAP